MFIQGVILLMQGHVSDSKYKIYVPINPLELSLKIA